MEESRVVADMFVLSVVRQSRLEFASITYSIHGFQEVLLHH